jgi:hypothetical protein
MLRRKRGTARRTLHKKAGGRDTTGFFYATAGFELRCRRESDAKSATVRLMESERDVSGLVCASVSCPAAPAHADVCSAAISFSGPIAIFPKPLRAIASEIER